jgi:hypothetical protein
MKMNIVPGQKWSKRSERYFKVHCQIANTLEILAYLIPSGIVLAICAIQYQARNRLNFLYIM